MVDAKYAKIIDEIVKESKGDKRKLLIDGVIKCALADDDVPPLDFIVLCIYSNLKRNSE